MGPDFNIQRGCFIPKNKPSEGSDPRADELRSLGLKNSDNKIITGTNVRRFSYAVSKFAVSIQRGFVCERQLVLNIVDLDVISRALGNLNHFPSEAILALWDFLAAFPSVRHKWVLVVFRHYGFPEGFCLFLEALFHHNFAIYVSKGFQSFLYLILAGIVQGCPSAGLCFAVAADPFFRELEVLQRKLPSATHQSSHIAFRGCADDIGGALASFKLLKIAKPIFDKAADFAGLKLNPSKCVLIPVCYVDFPLAALAIQEWVARHLPEWKNFKIVRSHAYLGPAIGPSAGDSIWDKSIAKYWARVLSISNLGLSAYYSILAYNTCAVSCLEYLCQLYCMR
jgi:hypothetical protein